jgi:hypothetical protein
VHGGDDLLGVDSLQVDRGRAEVRVAELALDDVERNPLAGELERMSVSELMGREAPADARPGCAGEARPGPRQLTRAARA